MDILLKEGVEPVGYVVVFRVPVVCQGDVGYTESTQMPFVDQKSASAYRTAGTVRSRPSALPRVLAYHRLCFLLQLLIDWEKLFAFPAGHQSGLSDTSASEDAEDASKFSS